MCVPPLPRGPRASPLQVYGTRALERNEGFTSAQGARRRPPRPPAADAAPALLNLVETALNVRAASVPRAPRHDACAHRYATSTSQTCAARPPRPPSASRPSS